MLCVVLAQVVALAGDITSPQAPATIAEAVRAEFGRIDVLVNNAGRWVSGAATSSAVCAFMRAFGGGCATAQCSASTALILLLRGRVL